MGRSVLPLALLFGGCFQLDRPDPPAADGAPPSDARADAGQGDAPGDAGPLGPFGPPTPLVELNAPLTEEDDPTLTADLLEIYFNSDRAALGLDNADIWRATRPAPSVPFGLPLQVVELNSPAVETSPKVSGDGLTLYFTSNRDSPSLDVWVAARPSRDVPWGAPVKVVELSSPGEESSPAVSSDRLHAILSSAGLGPSLGLDYYETARAAPGVPWGVPALLPSLSSPAPEGEIWLDADGRTAVFASERGGGGNADLWTAVRPGWGADFTSIASLPELNSAGSDNDPWLSPDQRTIVFASTRGGDYDLYQATR